MLRIGRNFRLRYAFSSEQETFKTHSIQVAMPIFPLSRHTISLSSTKYHHLNRLKVTNVTAIMRREINSQTQNLIDQYHSIGTYCNITLKEQSSTYQMILNGVQRVQVQSLIDRQISDIVEESIPQDTQQTKDIKETNQFVLEGDQEDDYADNNNNVHDQENMHDEQNNINDFDHPQISTPQSNHVDPHPEVFLQSVVRFIQDPQYEMNIQLESQLKHLIDTYSKILYMNRSQVPLVNYNFSDAYRIIDSLAGFLGNTRYYQPPTMQETLETLPLAHRLDLVHNLMINTMEMLEYINTINHYYQQLAQQNLKSRKANEFYNEMFKIVKGAVEGKKGKEAIIETMSKRMGRAPEHVQKIFKDESARYLQMDDMSSESNMLRTYLESVSSLPYGVTCQENRDLAKAKEILDQDHYGMEDIKERILEFIAVSSLSATNKGRILLLVGPPGVGKTSLASSIARAIGRPFARISMGGENDVSFFKGHRRTYVGAYPGKIIQALKQAQKENCVILLDEVDKLGRSEVHGDPQSTLLEVLDPEQNVGFTDNYLDYPVDLSKVLFICSANSTDNIQAPLLDRMDVIELSSYTEFEKKEIFKRHLLNKAIADTGLTSNHNYQIQPEVLDVLVRDYCREPGVRSLQQYTKKIVEKIAYEIIEQQEQDIVGQERETQNHMITISPKDLPRIIGQPRFQDFSLKNLPPGVVIGLAYTQYGGSLLYLEVTQAHFLPRGHKCRLINSGLKVTGSLGDVMQESIQISYTYAKVFAHNYLKNYFFENNELHIHAPEGAIPKDGPSAGITVTSALLSLAQNTQIPNDIAMTGEISLNGHVLPIGGCKEKILAAQREGIKRLIFPEKNRASIQQLKIEVTEGIEILYVREYRDVFSILFPHIQLSDPSKASANELTI